MPAVKTSASRVRENRMHGSMGGGRKPGLSRPRRANPGRLSPTRPPSTRRGDMEVGPARARFAALLLADRDLKLGGCLVDVGEVEFASRGAVVAGASGDGDRPAVVGWQLDAVRSDLSAFQD